MFRSVRSLFPVAVKLVVASALLVAGLSLGPEQARADSGTGAMGTGAIDTILQRAHRAVGVEAVSRCDDRTFLRRVSLDLIGRVPTVAEIRQFDRSADRAALVDRLLLSDEFSYYWSQLWATVLVGRSTDDAVNREALRLWLEAGLADNRPFDQLAFDLIAAQGVTALNGPVNFIVAARDDPVTNLSRIFLGVQLDCARCHDHPYDRWTEEDYQAMRLFFAPLQFEEVSGGVRLGDRGGGDGERPRFLTGARPRTAAWRKELALMTVRCKPFGRAIGNRVWQLLFGTGIVDPVDGLSQERPASVPELHQWLADRLAESGFDLRDLVRVICISDAYQREVLEPSSTLSAASEPTLRLFAARRVRPLTPEQLVRSYATVTSKALPDPERCNQLSIEFLGSSAAERGAVDPLQLERTSQGLLRELAYDASARFASLEEMFLSVLVRPPTDQERQHLNALNREDLLYGLLHCNEFVYAH